MWLNSLVSGMQNTAATYNSGKTNADPVASEKLTRYIAGMKAGQTIQGEIVAKNGNEIAIKLSDDMTMNARLENDMELELGKLLTLEVRSNTGGTLSLSPLFENMGMDANVLKALSMAGLPANDRTLEMADAMMKNGMSISKDSLHEVFKEVVTFKDYSPTDIVSLHKLGVDVKTDNLEQLDNYKNLNHQVIKGMTDVLEELPETFNTLVSEGKSEEALKLYEAVVKTVVMDEVPPEEGTVTVKAPVEGSAETAMPDIKAGNPDAEAVQTGNQTMQESAGKPEVTTNLSSEIPMAQSAENAEKGPAVMTEQMPLSEETKGQVQNNTQQTGQTVTAPQAGTSEETDVAQTPQKNPEVTLQTLTEQFEEAKTPEQKLELFASKEFQQLVKDAVIDKWTLKPEEVFDKEKVDALYQRLRTGLSHLEAAANETAGPAAPLTQAVTNLSNNLEFMNQLNQMYTYVQLPLKMSDGENHGELYVYTNKHSLASKDGTVSAFLHLDMDNLGPVDCYVAMKDMKVNTNFKLKDEETLMFIEAHMDILNDRLAKRGYSMNSKCTVGDLETNAMEEMLKTDSMKVFGGHHSFDVRT